MQRGKISQEVFCRMEHTTVPATLMEFAAEISSEP